jgi:hypothetical protein
VKEPNNKVEGIAMPRTVEEVRDILARFEKWARGLRGTRAWRTAWWGMCCGLLDERWRDAGGGKECASVAACVAFRTTADVRAWIW